MISKESIKAAADKIYAELREWYPLAGVPDLHSHCENLALYALEAAAPHMGEVEWTVFRASDGPNGSPAENLRYSTKSGAQESIDTRYGTPELWEPRSRIVGEWRK